MGKARGKGIIFVKNGNEQNEITVTQKATRLMADYFKDKPKQAVRLFVRLGGCGIRTFGIAVEPSTASDRVFEIDGFTYVISKRLLERVRPIYVDSDGIAFLISGSGISPSHGCGNCGNMCGVRGGNRCTGDCADCGFQCGHRPRSGKAS